MENNTLEKKQSSKLRRFSPFGSRPFERFFKNDFLDFWDNDRFIETMPSINITEEKNNYLIDVAAPGLKKEDFDVSIEGNLLTISCEKETESTNGKENGNYSRREYSYSSFSRTVSLPEYAENKNIHAKYDNGILTITVPKKPEAPKSNNQKINVQ